MGLELRTSGSLERITVQIPPTTTLENLFLGNDAKTLMEIGAFFA